MKKPSLRIVIILCIAVFLVWNVYLLNVQTLQGNALPMPLGFGAAVVLSGSMEPTLQIDDLIFVKSAESYAVGEIIVYQSAQSLVVHRIVQITDDAVITQGDANNAPDEPVEYSCIKGKVAGRIAGMGAAVRAVKSPVVSFLLMGLAIFLLERSFRRDKRKNSDEIAKMEAEIRRLKAEAEE